MIALHRAFVSGINNSACHFKYLQFNIRRLFKPKLNKCYALLDQLRLHPEIQQRNRI